MRFTSTPNFLASSVLTRSQLVRRETFDPVNQEHIESLKYFLETGSWGKVHFFTEEPFTDVPTSVLMKMTAHATGANLNFRSKYQRAT